MLAVLRSENELVRWTVMGIGMGCLAGAAIAAVILYLGA